MIICPKVMMLIKIHRKRTPHLLYQEGRLDQSCDVQPPISRDEEPSTSKRPSSKVTLNHPISNIIGDLDEGLHLRKGPCC